MSAKTVKWFAGAKPAEIYQSFNMKFSFANVVDGKILQCHQWVKCRDFLHDAIRTMLTGNKSSIYSFVFEKGKNTDISMDKIRFLISKKDIVETPAEFKAILTKSLKLINYFEALIGEDLSTVQKVEPDKKAGYKHVWLFTGPRFWLEAPYLVSLYTLLLRLGDKKLEFKDTASLRKAFEKLSKEAIPSNENDLRYLKAVWSKVEMVVTKHKELANPGKDGFSDLYYKDAGISSFHNSTGIVSACGLKTWCPAFNKRATKILKEKK